MTDHFAPVVWLAGLNHPRLALISMGGAVLGIIGLALPLLAPLGDIVPVSTGLRLAIAGVILFLFGSTGYLAFAFFEMSDR